MWGREKWGTYVDWRSNLKQRIQLFHRILPAIVSNTEKKKLTSCIILLPGQHTYQPKLGDSSETYRSFHCSESYGRWCQRFCRFIELGFRVFNVFFVVILLRHRQKYMKKSTILGFRCKDLGMKIPDWCV